MALDSTAIHMLYELESIDHATWVNALKFMDYMNGNTSRFQDFGLCQRAWLKCEELSRENDIRGYGDAAQRLTGCMADNNYHNIDYLRGFLNKTEQVTERIKERIAELEAMCNETAD